MVSKLQPQQSFFQQGVEPSSVASIVLSAGKIPYSYTLGVNSTVPFVKLEGEGGWQLELSWGEVVTIPPGIACNVRNVSAHKGDIQIQSGHHPAVPARITISMDMTQNDTASVDPNNNLWITPFIDTRRARRAWYYIREFIDPPDEFASWSVAGYFNQHTAPSRVDNNTLGALPVPSWMTQWDLPPGTVIGALPLGFNAQHFDIDSTIAMALPDYVAVMCNIDEGISQPIFGFAVLEYL